MKLFDLHCDTLTACLSKRQSLWQNTLHWDVNRACKLFERSFQIAAMYIEDNMNETDAWNEVLRIFSFLKSQQVPVVQHPNDMRDLQCGVLLAVENGAAIGCDLSKLRKLAEMGVVYITLTWNGSNAIGNGCLSKYTDGLTPFGKNVVREMLRLGLLPDVSHLNESGFWDVVELSDGRPILASHSVSAAVYSHPRNLSDSQFCAVIESGGLVGLNICESQLGAQTFEQFESHIYHFLGLNGERGTALGLDLDGTPLRSDWNGIAFVTDLFEYLLKKGYSEILLEKLFFENSYSFFLKSLTSREKCIRIGT